MGDQGYELEVLLKLRKKERDQAEAQYADALAALKKVVQKVQRLEYEHHQKAKRRVRECRDFDEQLVSQASAISQIQEFDRYVLGLRDAEERAWSAVETAKREQQRLRRQMEVAHQTMLKALRQLKAVEKHFEKWQRDQAAVKKRRESAKMDDVAARLWREVRGP